MRTIPLKLTSFALATGGLAVLVTLSGCLSPDKRVTERVSELRTQWYTNVPHQASLPARALDWDSAVAFLQENNLRFRRSRFDVTNAQENVRQIFKDLLPALSFRSGISQTVGEIPMTTWDDVIFDVNGFLNIPGIVSLNTRYFSARLILMRAEALYELGQREQFVDLYKLMLAFQEHQEARAALEGEQQFANAVLAVDDVTGKVLLRESEARDLALVKESDSLQQRAGDLLGDRRYRWVLTTNGAPGLNYEANPLPLMETNRIAQLQMRLVAIELVGAWARLVGIKLQYWPEMRLFVSGPPVYSRRAGNDTFFDAEQIRVAADVFWRVDTRGQVAKQVRQTRRDQEMQVARINQETLALIDRILAAQRILNDLRTEIAELSQLIPIVESVPPPPDFTSIVKAAETRRTLRDRERRLRRDLAELNTLFWFVDEQKWSQHEKLF